MLHPNKAKNKRVKKKKQPKATSTETELGHGEETQGRRSTQEVGIQNRMQNRVTIYECNIIQITSVSFKRIAINF